MYKPLQIIICGGLFLFASIIHQACAGNPVLECVRLAAALNRTPGLAAAEQAPLPESGSSPSHGYGVASNKLPHSKSTQPSVLQPQTKPECVLYQETLRFRGFDPARASDVASGLAIGRIYECLFQYAYLDRPYRVEPLLADGLPEISSDGLTYTFKIRKGIFFQDDPCFTNTAGKGRELRADDFVYSIKRLADARTLSTGYWIFQGRIKGLDDFKRRSSESDPIDYSMDVPGLRAPDAQTLVIVLEKPYPQLMWVLAMHYAATVPREAVQYYGRDFTSHPVGTGPYLLKSCNPNYRIEYVRNPKWHEAGRIETFPTIGTAEDQTSGLLRDAGQQLPFIDRIVDYVISDPSTKWLMFLRGQLDRTDISRDNWEVVMREGGQLNPDLRAKGIQLFTGPALRIAYLSFNMDDPLLGANRALRQALSCAFDHESWIKVNNYRVQRPNGPIPQGLAGSTTNPPPFTFDVSRAEQLLVEAGFPKGIDPSTGRRLQLTLELGSADNPETRQTSELIVNFMDRIGVVINLSYNNGPAFYDKLEKRRAQMFLLSWIGDYPDAENFLQLFYGPNCSPGPNRSNYVNPAFDQLYDQARVLQDGPERTALYEEMATIVMQDCPWIFVSEPVNYVLNAQRLGNYKMHAFPYGMEKYYRLDEIRP